MFKGETYQKLRDFLFYRIELPISNFITGIKNLITWRDVIWSDVDYDFSGIYDILEFKLKKQYRHFKKHGHLSNCDIITDRLKLCVRLLHMVKTDYYINEIQKYQNIKYEFVRIPDNDSLYELKCDLISEQYDEYIQKYKSVYNKLISGKIQTGNLDFTNMKSICMYIARYNQKRAKKLLFNVLEKNIETWWD